MTGAPESFGDAAHDGRGAVEVDAGAHAHELGHMHEAVLEDGLGDHRGALGDGHQRHELGLHVGGEAGEGLGHHVGAAQAVEAGDGEAGVGLGDIHAAVAQVAGDGAEVYPAGRPGGAACRR
jgi:hypothetical protein